MRFPQRFVVTSRYLVLGISEGAVNIDGDQSDRMLRHTQL
jgi:hypothetical protein